MTWDSESGFEGVSLDDLALRSWAKVMKNVRESGSSVVLCRLAERLNYLDVGRKRLVLTETNDIKEVRVKLPETANFYLEVSGGDRKVIAEDFLGKIDRDLDEDEVFRDYPVQTVQLPLLHQAGLRLKQLLPVVRECYFSNVFDEKGFVPVNASHLDRMLFSDENFGVIGEQLARVYWPLG